MTEQRVRRLKCCCCGERCRGRQWWNRDTGYGLCGGCGGCAAWMRKRGESDAEMHDNYGVRGVHYDLPETDQDDDGPGEAPQPGDSRYWHPARAADR